MPPIAMDSIWIIEIGLNGLSLDNALWITIQVKYVA